MSTPAPPAAPEKAAKPLGRRSDYSIPCKMSGKSVLKSRICQIHLQPDVVCEQVRLGMEIRNLVVELKEETARRLFREWQLENPDQRYSGKGDPRWNFDALSKERRKEFLDKAEAEIKTRWGDRRFGE